MKTIFYLLTSTLFQLYPVTPNISKIYTTQTHSGKNTVLDYYLKIPSGTFMCDNYKDKDNKEYRINSIVRMDIRNGYLLSRHGDLIWLQVALFTYNSKDVVGVVASCGMGCMCNEKVFYEVQSNGDLKDVTAEIIPKEFDDAGWFILPEKGTTIDIYDYDILDQYDFKTMTKDQEKGLLHELVWANGKFSMKK